MGEAAKYGTRYYDNSSRQATPYRHQKKAWHQTTRELIQGTDAICLQSICRLFGYSRQSFYKHQKTQMATISKTQLIIEQVLYIRKQQPRCGGRKLMVMLQP